MAAEQSKAFEDIVASDKLIHEPARLAVLSVLSACESADFVFLQRLTGLQSGNLSQHLAKLEQAGLINLIKAFNGKYPQTTAQITAAGRAAFAGHWQRLDALREAIASLPSGERS